MWLLFHLKKEIKKQCHTSEVMEAHAGNFERAVTSTPYKPFTKENITYIT